MPSNGPQRIGPVGVLVLAAVLSGLLVAALVLRDALAPPQPSDPTGVPRATPIEETTTVAVQQTPALPEPPSAAAAVADATGVPNVTEHRRIALRMLLSEFLAERGRLLRDRALARTLFDGGNGAVFEALAARSRNGDADATLALTLVNDFVCDELAPMTARAGWEEELRGHLNPDDDTTQRVLSDADGRHFRGVASALTEEVLRLARHCAVIADDLRAARSRLAAQSGEAGGAAMIALAYDSTHYRKTLAERIGEFEGELLYEALDVLHAKDGCEYQTLIEPLAARAAAGDVLFADLHARIRDANCDGATADVETLIGLYLAGALAGDRRSFEAYRALMQAHRPGEARIANYAIDLYQQRLTRRGCMGMLHFMLREALVDSPDIAGGLHLSPYEYDAALERSERLWRTHAAQAMALHRCAE